MSYKLVDRVFDLEGLPKREKAALLSLAKHAHNDGTEAYPSYARMARETGWSRDQMKRAVHSLLKFGFIVMTQAADAAMHRAAHWRLELDNPRALAILGALRTQPECATPPASAQDAPSLDAGTTDPRGDTHPESVPEPASQAIKKSGSQSVRKKDATDGLSLVFTSQFNAGSAEPFGMTKAERVFFKKEIKRKGFERVAVVVRAFAHDKSQDFGEMHFPAKVLASRWSDYTAMYGDEYRHSMWNLIPIAKRVAYFDEPEHKYY